MQNKVLQRPTPNATLPRNGFDRGFEMKYNFSSGMALPVFCEPVLGETKMRINRKCLFRTSQLQTAAMVRNSYNIDFFFVPMRQLWSYYGTARTGTRDYHSSKLALNSNVSLQNLPRFAAATSSTDHDLWKMVSHLAALGPSNANPDIHGFDPTGPCIRLLDLLNYGVNETFNGTDSDENKRKFNTLPAMSPFKLLAYQKVWYDHYRNTNYVANEPQAYNVDNLLSANGSTSAFSYDQLALIGTMHYVPYRKDYFQNIYPSLNYSGNQMGDSFFKVPNNVAGASFEQSNLVSSSTVLNRTTVESQKVGGFSIPVMNSRNAAYPTTALTYPGVTFSAQSIRALFALDKMTRLAAYAPKHIADQFEARFGFRPKGEDINESVRIGSFVSDVSIGEVVSTADSFEAPLGAIGGRGYSVSDYEQDIEYTAPEDGIVIGIGYTLPRLSYDAGGIDEFNTIISSSALPQPEFMDLGLQPLRQRELFHITQESELYPAATVNNLILGYQPMYSAWKIGRDRNHGLFIYNKYLAQYSTHTKVEWSDLVSNPVAWREGDGVSARYFYASPRDLNSIFAASYDGAQLNDQFFGMIYFKFDVVQNFSIHGQPRI